MPIFARRTHSGRPRAALLVALLLLTLSLAGILAYQAQNDKTLRITGLVTMAVGVVLLYLARLF